MFSDLNSYSLSKDRLAKLQSEIDTPLMFLIDPATSIARIESQKSEGLDYSALCVGLNTRDTHEDLQKLLDRYKEFQGSNGKIRRLLITGSLEDTFQSVLAELNLDKHKNGRS